MVFPLYDETRSSGASALRDLGLLVLNVVIFLYQLACRRGDQAFLRRSARRRRPCCTTPRRSGRCSGGDVVTYMFCTAAGTHHRHMVYLWVSATTRGRAGAVGSSSSILAWALPPLSASRRSTRIDDAAGGRRAQFRDIAAYLLLRPCAKVSIFFFRMIVRVRAFWVIGGWILLQLLYIASQTSDGVAYSAHGAGLVAGAILFLVMRPAGVPLLQCVEQPGEGAAAS